MKTVILAFSLMVSSLAFAEKTLKLDSVGFSKNLYIDADIQLPKGQKLNLGAPSKISVYEKERGQWQLAKEISLNDFFTTSESMQFRQIVPLKSDKSEIKVEASLYHCPLVGKGICVIDDFEGAIKRNPKKASGEVRISLVGSPPR